jgi:hypothetical protein
MRPRPSRTRADLCCRRPHCAGTTRRRAVRPSRRSPAAVGALPASIPRGARSSESRARTPTARSRATAGGHDHCRRLRRPRPTPAWAHPRARQHLLRQLRLRAERDRLGNPGLAAPQAIREPRLGEVQLAIHERVTPRSGVGEEGSDLAVLDAAGRPAVLRCAHRVDVPGRTRNEAALSLALSAVVRILRGLVEARRISLEIPPSKVNS